MKDESIRARERLEQALAGRAEKQRYVLRLYVTGMTRRSSQAVSSVKTLCEEHLQGRYELEVIDLYKNPELARESQVIAVPTLVRELPSPLRRLIGDLSDEERVLVGLDLQRRN